MRGQKHARSEFQIKHLPWPKLEGQDLTDLLVYVRSISGTRQQTSVFEITSGDNAETIFKNIARSATKTRRAARRGSPVVQNRPTLLPLAIDAPLLRLFSNIITGGIRSG